MTLRDAGRDQFPHFLAIPTRWMDNDQYGHVNNVVYYSYFDTAVNQFLIARGVLDTANSAVVGFVVDSGCSYFGPVSFPDLVHAGIRVSKLGNSSVRYEVGLFLQGEPLTVAKGHFVHVYVDRATRRPTALPERLRRVLESLQ